MIFVGPSSGDAEGRRITAYNTSTRVATVDAGFSTARSAGMAFLVGQINYPLVRRDFVRPMARYTRPVCYSRVGVQLEVHPTPDKLYAIEVIYSWNLTQVDETDSRFIKHLRERRHLWVQGVKVKTMAKFDDDRYGAEKQIWEQMLAQYAAQNVVYSQMEGYR